MKKVENVLELKPMEEYVAPCLPTQGEKSPELLEKMPLRWKRKALLTGAGLLTAAMIAGCNSGDGSGGIQPPGFLQSGNENDYDWDIHHGGAGEGPIYFVYLTEQEMLGILQAKLKEVGLELTGTPPEDYVTIDMGWRERTIEIDLFNEEHNIGVVVLEFWGGRGSSTSERAQEIRSAVTQHFGEEGIHVGVLFGGDQDVWSPRYKEQAEDELREYFVEQIESFIEELRNENIID